MATATARKSQLFALLQRLNRWRLSLPRGGALPKRSWQSRHRAVVMLIWLHAGGLFAYGLLEGFTLIHMCLEAGLIAASAMWAGSQRGGRTFRTLAACFGLVTSSAVLTHLSGGYIEAHFHFFVMLAVIAIYEEWLPFVLSVLYVAVHHGIVGTIDPTSVYNHSDAINNPLKWAAIHAGFILFACTMYVLHWRWNEIASDQAKHVLRSAGEGILGVDLSGQIMYANLAAGKILGRSPSSLVDKQLAEVLHPDLANLASKTFEGATYEASISAGGRTGIPIEYTVTPTMAGSSVAGVVVTFKDISARRRSEEALRESEARYRTLFERNLAGVYRTTLDGQILECNDALARMMGYNTPAEVLVRPAAKYYERPDDRSEFLDQLKKEGTITNHEKRLRRNDGQVVWVLESAVLLSSEQGDVIEGTMIDITDRIRAEETVKYLAYHDALTDLPNRSLLEDRLAVAVAQAKRNHQALAVVFLDIDHFKLVNDTLGHLGGDSLLMNLAERLQRATREGDTVARIGGDEFVLILTELDGVNSAIEIIQRVRESIVQPCMISGQELRITASLGVSLFPDDGDSAPSLLRNADTAMYRAKDQGRDNYQLYTQAMGLAALERITLESELRRAIELGEFVVHFQPIISLPTGEISGCEALVRWDHPTRGRLSPSEFIPLAEETGLILTLDEFVMRTACLKATAWQNDNARPVRVSVNLSSHRLRYETIEETIRSILSETGLQPSSLMIEITEGMLMQETSKAAAALHRLREMGVRIAIDDFGTGFSSLTYLRRLPIDCVKIDRSFVSGIPSEREDVEIVSAIITLALKLGIDVVAEGVENEQQALFLAEQGCGEAQGFLYSRPVGGDEITRVLDQKRLHQPAAYRHSHTR